MSTIKRFVAFIDILGFKSIFNYIDNADILGDQMNVILQSSIRAALTGSNVEVDDNSNLNDLSDIKLYQFSDSIVLYTEDDSQEILMKFITALNLLFAQSILRGFPLRGALTKGDLYVRGNIVVGEPLINAYNLESRQEWAGLIVNCDMPSSTLTLLESEKLVVKHKVSMKNNIDKAEIIEEEHLVINWPQYLGMKISSKEDFKRGFSSLSGEPVDIKDIKKKERTVDFLEKNLGNKVLPSFIFGTGRVVLMKDGHLGFMKD
ncbi:hypothetical protein J2T12_001041 [Paenibacillus anaericanus]|uniref:hypothetical protein n=1 Tax=Paenibacillus anaericanus TaxID=170367 RepID=UPI00278390A1|nr:hypothetical protein [Paenibacillus anaericanus]MDQ0087635.1 hypothetical protein [Paenibacillus anaericanus]